LTFQALQICKAKKFEFSIISVPVVFSKSVNVPFLIAPCPTGSRPLLRPDGEPRKCLPHQNRLCVNALPDRPNARTVCCYNNQVDYFCCLDTRADQCPDYQHVSEFFLCFLLLFYSALAHTSLARR
ncbi:hypothetical protein OESDEN_15209, partial [Oesophagostomum dentatum]